MSRHNISEHPFQDAPKPPNKRRETPIMSYDDSPYTALKLLMFLPADMIFPFMMDEETSILLPEWYDDDDEAVARASHWDSREGMRCSKFASHTM